jgi:hypothetical protein
MYQQSYNPLLNDAVNSYLDLLARCHSNFEPRDRIHCPTQSIDALVMAHLAAERQGSRGHQRSIPW